MPSWSDKLNPNPEACPGGFSRFRNTLKPEKIRLCFRSEAAQADRLSGADLGSVLTEDLRRDVCGQII